MNSFHLLVMTAVAIACPSLTSAQSIIDTAPTATTLQVATSADGHLTLTASVATLAGSGVPGGSIRFIDDATLIVLGWTDVAHPSITVPPLPAGPHRLHADYSGTSDFASLVVLPSQSAVTDHTVRAVPAVALSSSDNPCAPGAVVTLTAAMAGADGVPKGTVTFRDGDHVLAAHVGLDRAGIASFTTSALAGGVRRITAQYEGDAVHAPVASPLLAQRVGALQTVHADVTKAD